MGLSTGCGGAGATITRLAVGDPGPDAYTLVAGVDDKDVTRRMEAGGEMGGDEPGLYGGTRKAAGCDKTKLVEFLQANPEKADAWASVHGIAADAIKGFVDGLTPAVLRVDTFVTNHGFKDGKATSMQAVLQAGIGVMVDAKGLPVVKCNCGNPLTAPDKKIKIGDSSFKGAEWPGFDKNRVTTIEPPGKDVKSLQLVDSDEGMIFDRPIGSAGGADGSPKPIPPEAQPAPVPSDGTNSYTVPPSTGTDGSGPASVPPSDDPPGTPSGGPTDAPTDPGDPTTGPDDPAPPKEDPPTGTPPEVDPPKADPPKEDPPREDPPQEDPPKEDPPEQDPPSADPPQPEQPGTPPVEDSPSTV